MYNKIKSIKKEYEEQNVPSDIENLIVSTFRSEQKKLLTKKRITNGAFLILKGGLCSAIVLILTFTTIINSFPPI